MVMSDQSLRQSARYLGVLVSLVGLSVLAGWALHNETLKTIFPGLVTMKANTALGLTLGGCGLVVLAQTPMNRPLRLTARLCAMMAGAIGVLSLSEYFFGWNLGIDELLFRDVAPSVGTSGPGRMAPSTAFCFMLVALAILAAAGSESPRLRSALLSAIGAALAAIGGIGCVGQITDVLFGFRIWNYFGMALHTAAGFALLGVGFLFFSRSEVAIRWALDKRVTVGFIVSIAILLTAAGISWNYTHQLEDASASVSRGREILRLIEEIRADRATAEDNQRGYLILGDEKMLATRQSLHDEIQADLASIRRLAADDPAQQKEVDRIKSLMAQRLSVNNQILATRRQDGFSPAQQMLATGPSLGLGAQITQALQSLRDEETGQVAVRVQKVDSTSTTTFLLLPIAVFLSMTLLSLALFFLNEGMDERARATEEVRKLNATLEQRVRDRTAELEAANKELEAFSYSVSHDLRAPLRAVDGFSQMALQNYGPLLPAEGLRLLNTIRAGAQKMGALIDDLLAFSRLGRAALREGPVDMEKLASSVIAELHPEMNGHRIEIRKGALPPCVGDAALLKQVWINLLSNAIKYSRQRDPAVIEIDCKQDEANTYFVRDNGAGFDMRYARKLFGVFQRLHRADQFEGTGVGLAIVQRIVHRHGGSVRAEAAVDQGATFYFTLKKDKESPHD